LLWVKSGKAQTEQRFPGLPLKADASEAVASGSRALWAEKQTVLGRRTPRCAIGLARSLKAMMMLR